MFGTLARVVVNRLFGCAHGVLRSASDRSEISSPFQSRQPVTSAGGSGVLPSHQTSCGVLVVGDVGEDRAGALGDRRDRRRVGRLVGVLGDAEDPELRVDRVDAGRPRGRPAARRCRRRRTSTWYRSPRASGGQRHRQVGLARGARECRRQTWYVRPVCLSVDAEQHELLGEELPGRPAVVGGLAQAVGDLAQQRVAAVGRAEVQDRALVGDGDEVALVVGGALAEVLQVAGDVDARGRSCPGRRGRSTCCTPTRAIRIMCSTTVRGR